MKKSGIYLILFVSSFLFAFCSVNSWADDVVSIVNYSLKPVGYVDNNKYLQTIYNVEVKNNEGTTHSFNFKIVFLDKEKNQIKEFMKKVEIQANETKKYTDAVLLEPEIAKQVASTKGYIENIQ
jgi:hypothetical protein